MAAWTPGDVLPAIDLATLLRTLHEHGVRYVLIGGMALNLFGIGLVTEDVDICYDASQENARALARALRALDAVPVDADLRPRPRPIDSRALQLHDDFLFITSAGRLDCVRVPDGTGGYDDLILSAVEHEVDGIPVVVPSYEDMRRMKRATNRPKDRLGLEALGALLDVIDDEPPPSVNPSHDVAIRGSSAASPPVPPPRPPATGGDPGTWVRVREHRRADGSVVREHFRHKRRAG